MKNTVWVNNPPKNKDAAKELLCLSLEDKVTYTCANISGWDMFTGGDWYISFSGGKDSTVLLYIAAAMMNQMADQPHPLRVLFCDTGLEYPEIRKFVPWYMSWLSEKFQRVSIEYIRKRPAKGFYDVLRRYGYPVISKTVAKTISGARGQEGPYREYAKSLLRGEGLTRSGGKSKFNCAKYSYLEAAPFLISNRCCGITKEAPGLRYEKTNGFLPMVATMAEESMSRMNEWMYSGCNAYEGKRPISKPMSFWTNQDVLKYILQEEIPICSVYGDVLPFDGENFYENALSDMPLKCTGCQRTGCIFCAFGAHLEKGENRFQQLKRTHPKHWNYAINGGEWDPADGMWKPSKTPGHIGLGMGRVLDFIGVPYE